MGSQSSGDELDVEAIVGQIEYEGKVLYRVRWKGFPPEEDTFEPIEHLDGCGELLSDYFNCLELSRSQPKAAKERSGGGAKPSPKPSPRPKGQPEPARDKVSPVKEAVGKSLGVFDSDESSSTDTFSFSSDSEGPTAPVAEPRAQSRKPLLMSSSSSGGIQTRPTSRPSAREAPKKGKAPVEEKLKGKSKDRSSAAEPKKTQKIAAEVPMRTRAEAPKKAKAATDEPDKRDAAAPEGRKMPKAAAVEEPRSTTLTPKAVAEEPKAPKKGKAVTRIDTSSDESVKVEAPPKQKAPEPKRPTAADLMGEKAQTTHPKPKEEHPKRKNGGLRPRSHMTVTSGVVLETEFDLADVFPVADPGPIPVPVFEQQAIQQAELVDPFPIRRIDGIQRVGKITQLLCQLPGGPEPVWIPLPLVEILSPDRVIAFLQTAEAALA
jgi:hypothetical protein